MPPAFPLHGVGVLVTRPAGQSRHLAQLITAAGGEAILFPALEILDAADLLPLHALIDRLDEFDCAIFISPTAVHKAMGLIHTRREWPSHLLIAAIGRGTGKALEHCGMKQIVSPQQQFDSEGLLALPQFHDMDGKKVVIFRGEGGREVLGHDLQARGAQVEYAECYRRSLPQIDPALLLQRWERGDVHAVVVTSGEGLRNLFKLLGEKWLKATPLFVPHPRIADSARTLGVAEVIVAPPGDEGLLTNLIAWNRNRKA